MMHIDPVTASATRIDAIEAMHRATSIYTSTHVVEQLLDRMGWPDADGRLLDPSAGDGSFVISALQRIDVSGNNNPAVSRIRGWEIHPGAVAEARQRVSDYLVSCGWFHENAHAAAAEMISCRDFIAAEGEETSFRFIAGNPPYLRFGHLPDYFKTLYSELLPKLSRGDLQHAFLDRCVDMLPEDGVIGFVTADRWLFNQTASSLRAEMGRKVGIDHLARLDVNTSFYRPKSRRRGSAPRVHPVEIVLRPLSAGVKAMTAAPVSPDGHQDEPWTGPTLSDIATVRLAPWLGPKGIFMVDADTAAGLEQEALVPAIDNDDIEAADRRVRQPTRYAIRTRKDCEPTGRVRDHLLAQVDRMPGRGRSGKWWMPPEAITLPLDRPALLIPRIGKKLNVIRIEPGILPVNHNLYIIADNDGPSLEEIEQLLLSDECQDWVARNAPPLEDDYLDIRATLLRRIPVFTA